jgi:signal transduction histidine kinase
VVVLSCAGWCGGRLLRGRAVLVERVRLAHGQLRAQRAAELRTTVLEQRAALARDVHDDVGHSLTVLALQAGAARRLAVRDPAASAAALAVVADVARRARARLTAEQDGPQDLGALVEQARRLGTTVTVEGDLERTPAVPAAARVLHRVLQECLTNVMRHAPGAAVTITFSAAADGFVLAVRNSAPLESSGLRGSGTGLDGMRARLADAGGTLESGPMPDGGFRVVARLPHLGAKELVG